MSQESGSEELRPKYEEKKEERKQQEQMRYQLEAETGHRPKPEEKRRCDEERDERR